MMLWFERSDLLEECVLCTVVELRAPQGVDYIIPPEFSCEIAVLY